MIRKIAVRHRTVAAIRAVNMSGVMAAAATGPASGPDKCRCKRASWAFRVALPAVGIVLRGCGTNRVPTIWQLAEALLTKTPAGFLDAAFSCSIYCSGVWQFKRLWGRSNRRNLRVGYYNNEGLPRMFFTGPYRDREKSEALRAR